MRRLAAFLAGLREFRLTITTAYDDDALADAYDTGRELAHRITRRRFEP